MGIFQNLIGGGWKRLFKKKKGGHVVATGEFLILHEKSAIYYLFFMQILNDPTHTVRHYFDSRQEWKIFTPEKETLHKPLIKPRFYPRLCQFLM